MLGDVFYSKAFFELSKMGDLIAQALSNAVLRLSRGEIEDVFVGEVLIATNKNTGAF